MPEPCLGHKRTQMCVSEHMEEDTDLCVRVCRQIMELFSVIPPVSFQVWLESRWLALM